MLALGWRKGFVIGNLLAVPVGMINQKIRRLIPRTIIFGDGNLGLANGLLNQMVFLNLERLEVFSGSFTT